MSLLNPHGKTPTTGLQNFLNVSSGAPPASAFPSSSAQSNAGGTAQSTAGGTSKPVTLATPPRPTVPFTISPLTAQPSAAQWLEVPGGGWLNLANGQLGTPDAADLVLAQGGTSPVPFAVWNQSWLRPSSGGGV
ncbi:MAG: hypothetical protein ACYDAR_20280 [Thermomicrobiales bacterium]